MASPTTTPSSVSTALMTDVTERWNRHILPELIDYIRIPAKSPAFDTDWALHGHLERVVQQAADWIVAQRINGMQVEIIRLEGRTPVLWFELPADSGHAVHTAQGASDADQPAPGASGHTVLMYGHLDKQPEFDGWKQHLGPWTPHVEDGRLYGRGGADDGYAVYASIAAIQALKATGQAHPRVVGLIETCEESGSFDLLPYIDALKPRLGEVGLVICLDSGAGNYDQLWLTTSLRGLASGTLKVEILDEGIHSGEASGLVASSFRIMRQLLDRLEDSRSGQLLPDAFHCDIPALRQRQARDTAAILGAEVYRRFPWVSYDCAGHERFSLPTTTDPVEGLLKRTWHPTLSVTGADGLPPLHSAGNVLRPYTAFKLSLRLPPLVDAATAVQQLKTLLEDQAPYQARVTFAPDGYANGWNAPDTAPWFEQALQEASQSHFGAPMACIGQGGTIPLMNLLSQGFPQAQMMVCGVLGPQSNAHGPNEFLHLSYARRLTAAVAEVMRRMP